MVEGELAIVVSNTELLKPVSQATVHCYTASVVSSVGVCLSLCYPGQGKQVGSGVSLACLRLDGLYTRSLLPPPLHPPPAQTQALIMTAMLSLPSP